MYRLSRVREPRPAPLKTYTTTFLWCGLQCLNLHEKTCRTFRPVGDGLVKIEECPYPNILDRIDHSETVKVSMWKDGSFAENDDLFTPSSQTMTGSTSSCQREPRSQPSRSRPSRA
jgi:hypothetical protein